MESLQKLLELDVVVRTFPALSRRPLQPAVNVVTAEGVAEEGGFAGEEGGAGREDTW